MQSNANTVHDYTCKVANSEHRILCLSSRSSVVWTEGLDVVINVYQQVKKAFIKALEHGLECVHQVSKGVHHVRFFTTCLITDTSTSKLLYSYDIACVDLFYYFVRRLFSRYLTPSPKKATKRFTIKP